MSAPRAPVWRCGWFENPSPGNAWLTDREGEWVVGLQGGHQAEGDAPRFKASQWIRTNNHYGYGCACMKVLADNETREIISILSASARRLKDCEDDRALKKPPA